MNKTFFGLATVVAAGLFAASNASAVPIDYASFSGTVIDFDDLAGSPSLGNGEQLGNQYLASGVTFDVPNYGAFATNGVLATASALASLPNVVWVDQDGGGGGALALGLTIDFVNPQTAVGLLFTGSAQSTFTLEIYNGATLLDSLTSGLAAGGIGLEGYLALQDTNITRAVVYSANLSGQNWNFSVDDLKFAAQTGTVPEPSALFLLGGGLAFLAARRRFGASK